MSQHKLAHLISKLDYFFFATRLRRGEVLALTALGFAAFLLTGFFATFFFAGFLVALAFFNKPSKLASCFVSFLIFAESFLIAVPKLFAVFMTETPSMRIDKFIIA